MPRKDHALIGVKKRTFARARKLVGVLGATDDEVIQTLCNLYDGLKTLLATALDREKDISPTCQSDGETKPP